jgi:inorganic pyrophosphatase
MNLKRALRFGILVAILLLPVVVQAQAPTPSPSPVRSLSENMAALTQRAASLLPSVDNEIVSKLIGWCELLAWVIGNCLAGFAMLRIVREDNGEGSNLYWWFGRLGLFFVLSGTSLAIINGMSAIGYEIANGNETRQQSVLQEMYLAQRDSFNDSYAKFQQNMFTVKVDGRETAIEPVPIGSESVLGIIVDSESTLKDFDRKADVSQWNISTMLTWLNFERALIEFGDLILVILGAALLLATKLAMPFMLAGIVDKHLASKTTYPFFYGVVALTLVWPSVSKIIRIVAYMWGNVAMAVGDGDPLYIWNYETMRAITDPLAQPQYTIALAAFGMGLGALCLYGTPFISLYFLSGRIYESVATVVSSWMGAMVGTGIEKYSAEAAASINRQAENTQYNAGYQADVTRSGGQMEAGNMRAQGQRSAQLDSIQAALTGQVAATQGAATTQRMIISAAAGFQKSATGSEVARSIRETNIGASREVGGIIAGAKRDLYMNAGNTSAAKLDQGVSLVNAMIPPEVPVARGLVEIPKYDAITKRNRTANEATEGFSRDMVQNQELVAGRIAGSAERYQIEMNQAIDKQAGAQIAGVNAGAGQAIGGYQRGAAQARGGVEQNYQREIGANKQIYTTQVDAAGQIRSAGFEAAKLRQAATVIAAVGREISREVGQGMRIRF